MLTLRPATRGDQRALEALLGRASLATGENVEALRAHPDALEIPLENLAHTLVAQQDGQILGFCTVLPVSDELAEVDALFVEPVAWRTGLGRLLLEAAEQQVAATGVSILGVVSGRYAQPFYEAYGFQPSGTERTRFGLATRLTKHVDTGLGP